jgi:hypothetical protein
MTYDPVVERLAGIVEQHSRILRDLRQGVAGTTPTTSLPGGTVTSVGLTVPSPLSVTPASITSSGTFAVTWSDQFAFTVFARQSGTGQPGFQSLQSGHIPNLPASKITSGALAVAVGGTGLSSYTVGDLLYADGAASLAKLAGAATGNVLISGGVGAAPSWDKVDLTVHVTGELGASHGGTGQGTYAVGDVLYADSTTTLARLADVATGNALLSGGIGVAPAWGQVGLTTHVTGVLPPANGGTGSNNTGNLVWDAAATISGGGTFGLGGFGFSVPASGTAVLGGGALAAGRIPIATDANTLTSDSAFTYDTASNLLVQAGRAIIGGNTALTELYTGSTAQTTAWLEIGSASTAGGASNYANLSMTADQSTNNGPIGGIVFGNRAIAASDKRVAYISAAISGTTTDAGALIFATANGGSPSEAMRITPSRAVWVGPGTGTLTGAGDLDVAGNVRVVSAATVGTTLTVPTVIAPAALTLQPASGSNITLSLANAGLLDLTKEFTTASGTVRGFLLQSRSAPAGASSATIEGLTLIAGVKEANAQTHSGLVTAFRAIALHGGTTTLPNLYGADFRSRANGGGTVSNTVNFYSLAELQNSSVITSLFCIRAGGAAITSGSVGTSYGVYIDPQKITGVTTGYGIYATGSDDTNYLAGNLGIGTSSAGVTLHLSKASALTNAVQEILRIDHNTSGTPAAGYGARLLYRLESSTTADQDAVALDAIWNVATHASRSAYLSIKVGSTSLAEVARFDKPTTATQTSLLLFDVDNNTVERVTVGAADSGGTGFKLLRIPN